MFRISCVASKAKWLEAKRALMECVVQPTDRGYVDHLHSLQPERYFLRHETSETR